MKLTFNATNLLIQAHATNGDLIFDYSCNVERMSFDLNALLADIPTLGTLKHLIQAANSAQYQARRAEEQKQQAIDDALTDAAAKHAHQQRMQQLDANYNVGIQFVKHCWSRGLNYAEYVAHAATLDLTPCSADDYTLHCFNLQSLSEAADDAASDTPGGDPFEHLDDLLPQ